MPQDRKTTEQKLAALRAKQKQLQGQAATLEARKRSEDRKRDARRKIVIGGAALAHAEHDPDWKHRLRQVLHKAVTRDIDKAVIGDLLGEPERPVPPGAPQQKNEGPR